MDNKPPLRGPAPETLARVVRWAILLFFAYALFTGSFHFHTQDKSASPEHVPGSVAMKETGAGKDCGSESGLNNFSMLAAALVPSRQPAIHVQDVRKGTGDGAICGQTATLRVEYGLENGTVVYSNLESKEPAQATIGEGRLLRGVETGMLGMQPGGERTLLFPAPLGFAAVRDPGMLLGSDQFSTPPDKLRSSIISAKIALVDLSPKLPTSSMQLRVIDHKFGGGARAECGDKVSVEMTLWKLDGTKLYSTEDTGKPAQFTLGLSQVPFGIEQSIMDMTQKSQRTIILPATYVKPLNSEGSTAANGPLAQVTLPDETMLAEVKLVLIGDDEKKAAKPANKQTNKKPPVHVAKKKKAAKENNSDDSDQ